MRICRTVASAFIAADDDQCNEALEPIFGKKHSCDMETTFCFKSMSNGTINNNVNNNNNNNLNSNNNNNNNNNAVNQPNAAAYTCVCNFGYYVPNQTLQGFEGHQVESGGGNYSCIRCPDECSHCDENGVCSIGEAPELISLETLLRFTIGIVLGACMLCCLVLAAIVFRQRKCKVRVSSRNYSPRAEWSGLRLMNVIEFSRLFRVACGPY